MPDGEMVEINVPNWDLTKHGDSYDFHVQIVDLMHSKEGAQAGVARFLWRSISGGTSWKCRLTCWNGWI